MTETPNPHIVDADTLTGEMRPIRRCVISMGSNLGDRLAKLQGGLDSPGRHPRGLAVTAVSPVYETRAGGRPGGVRRRSSTPSCSLDTTLPARMLLDRAQASRRPSAASAAASPTRRGPSTSTSSSSATAERTTTTSCCRTRAPTSAPSCWLPWADVEPDAEIPGVGSVAELLEKVGHRGRRTPGRPRARDAVSRDPVPDDLGPDPAGPGRDPSGDRPPGRLRTTDPRVLVGARPRRAGRGLGVRLLAVELGFTAPQAGWVQAGVLFLVAAILGSVAWATRRASARRRTRPSTGSCWPSRARWPRRSWPVATSATR